MRLYQNAPGSISGRSGRQGPTAAAQHRKIIQQNLPLKLRTDGFDCDAGGITKIAPNWVRDVRGRGGQEEKGVQMC